MAVQIRPGTELSKLLRAAFTSVEEGRVAEETLGRAMNSCDMPDIIEAAFWMDDAVERMFRRSKSNPLAGQRLQELFKEELSGRCVARPRE